ncbi:hypothetical protein KR100_05335 [Synechococcus sp. KORDI-100]|nr:hypothetical protein [Synechococcus sp. KORDI-100]AII42788.1 hypothetical protein KR100_05335 [Synechococcus sp. KORDI-100]
MRDGFLNGVLNQPAVSVIGSVMPAAGFRCWDQLDVAFNRILRSSGC